MKKNLLRTVLASCAALLAFGGAVSVVAQGQQPQVLVVQGGTLIDGLGGAPVPNSVIVVTGNRITAVGRQGQVQIPAGARVVNAAGKWVVPGFFDAKANWYWEYGEAFLHHGVTSAIISGGRNNLGLATRDAINHGIFPGPRLYQSVVNIGGPGSKLERPDRYQPGNGDRIPHTPQEAVDIVHAVHDAGGDIITFANGDGPPEIFDGAVKEAQRLGMGIDFRAMGPGTRISEACAMGPGMVYVHTGNAGSQMAKDPAKWATYIGLPPDAYADMDEAKVGPMIQRLLGCKAYLEPDLMAADRGFSKSWKRVQAETREVFTDPELLAYYPDYAIKDLYEHLEDPENYLTPEQVKNRAAGFANHVKFLKRYVDAGGKLVAASDITQTAPGLGIHEEMAVMVEDVGLTPMQAIQAGTKWVAEGFHQNDVGSIETGKLADIVLLSADPLQNILNTRKTDTVIKDGKVIDRGYHSWFAGSMFRFSPDEDTYDMIDGTQWAAALKAATLGRNRGGNPAIAGASAPPPPVQDPAAAPTPAIEGVAPHTILRGSSDTVVTVTGFNFVKRSRAYLDGKALPTRVVSRTQIAVTVPANELSRAGSFPIMIKNDPPLATPPWGSDSNKAYLLVPFEFTKVLPQPKW
jgi:imidazolonepropionase-like amidohydrolase